MQEARTYLLEQFAQSGDYSFLPEGVLESMLDTILALDEAFMRESGVENGEAYDDEAAEAALFAGMAEAFADYKMYMLRFTEEYLDYHEDYLISIDAIEWD